MPDITPIEYVPALMTVFSGFGGAQAEAEQGQALLRNAQFKAQQERTAAGQAIASSQRSAQVAGIQGQYALSTLIAHAVSQGGAATDPGVLNLSARIQNETAYKQAVDLYQGQEKSRVLNLQAQQDIYSGEVQKAAYDAKARATIMGSEINALSMFAKYGADKPTVDETSAPASPGGGDYQVQRYLANNASNVDTSFMNQRPIPQAGF